MGLHFNTRHLSNIHIALTKSTRTRAETSVDDEMAVACIHWECRQLSSERKSRHAANGPCDTYNSVSEQHSPLFLKRLSRLGIITQLCLDLLYLCQPRMSTNLEFNISSNPSDLFACNPQILSAFPHRALNASHPAWIQARVTSCWAVASNRITTTAMTMKATTCLSSYSSSRMQATTSTRCSTPANRRHNT